jgi:hypothetical protein
VGRAPLLMPVLLINKDELPCICLMFHVEHFLHL